jgi:hypothetical protein
MDHFVFKACPILQGGEVPSAACFDAHPLEFVANNFFGATKDPNYPYQAYIAPKAYVTSQRSDMLYSFKLQLPDNVVGNTVLLQWWWISANSCSPTGYDKHSFPAAWAI